MSRVEGRLFAAPLPTLLGSREDSLQGFVPPTSVRPPLSIVVHSQHLQVLMTRLRALRPILEAWSRPLLLGALVAGSLASCDNPACVFGTQGCQLAGSSGDNEAAATFPVTGEWVNPERPKVQHVFPEGFANPESPVVIVFSESISPASIEGAFSVRSTAGIGGGAGQSTSALVGDGRVLVIIPPPLIAGQEYEVVHTGGVEVTDLSGALLLRSATGVVGTFSVDTAPAVAPEVLMTWPLAGEANASSITEVVTVFTRIINPVTVTTSSWKVKLDGDDPDFNPLPNVLTLSSSVGGGPVQESRVWTWKSIDSLTGARADLGTNVLGTIEISTSSNPALRISSINGDAMEPVTNSFMTLDFAVPSTAAIESVPSDAIGIENLAPTGSRPLMISVDVPADVLDGDVLEIFIVGSNPPDPDVLDPPERISRLREFLLTAGPGPFLLEEADLGLVKTISPLASIFDDDDISFAFAVRRGLFRTPLRVLDVDPVESGVQDAFIDLTGPTFLNLLGKDEGDLVLNSDLRELSISGFASAEVRSAEVVAHLVSGDVDNLVGAGLPPLPIFASTGAFVAAPVDIGQLPFGETTVPVDMVVYDRALNPSEMITISYTQRGSSGVGMPISSGNDVDVTVFDSQTLAPVVGARVYRHESVGGVLTATITGVQITDVAGQASVSPAPGGETLITVEATGYDLFTFQSVPTTRLDVPLSPATLMLGVAGLGVSTPTQALESPFIHGFLADSRTLLPGNTVRESFLNEYNPISNRTFTTFSDFAVSLGEVGLRTFLATKDPADLMNPAEFSAGTFLQAFALQYPREPLGPPPPVDIGNVIVPSLLSGAEVPPSDIPVGTANQVFLKPPNYALDFPIPTGAPMVSVEAFTPGVRGMMTIGMGLAYFNSGADNWDIRAAYTAKAKAGGEFATNLTIEDDRLLRVEVVHSSGNRSGIRQPLSTATGTLTPPGVPLLTAPVGNSGGAAFDLVYENVITGPWDTQGLSRALLVDSVGRRWHLWTVDTPDGSGPIVAHVPPIALQGGLPLADGIITCFIDAWAWIGFDASALMFSDIDRRHEQFTSASPKVFSQP